MTKLTLSVDRDVIETAKRIAKANGTSVSAMFSQFIETMYARQFRVDGIGPITRELSDIAKLPPGKG